MKKITEANFNPKSIKVLDGKVEVSFDGTVSLGNDINSKPYGTLGNTDEPHIDFKKAMDGLLPVVAYDERDVDNLDYEIKGISLKGNEAVKIHHMKYVESGKTSRSSGWIYFDSEDFEKAELAQKAVAKIKHEAYEYFINYKRMQLTMELSLIHI